MLLTIPSVSMAAVLLASIALFGKLRTTTDMFHMSTEIIVVGAFSLMSLGESTPQCLSLPSGRTYCELHDIIEFSFYGVTQALTPAPPGQRLHANVYAS